MHTQGILILDFGSQYNQLIARRIRDFGIFTEILPYHIPLEKIRELQPKGIILSGGPSSVNADNARLISPEIYQLGIPILGICYGMQLTAHILGGKVAKGIKGEYGKAPFVQKNHSKLWEEIAQESTVWMSHFDEVSQVPLGFQTIGSSDIEIAAMHHEEANIYCVQFHPEVSHTEYGTQMLQNFVFTICNAEINWEIKNIIENSIKDIKQKVGNERVILGLSGGVDSSVSAVLIHKAIGDQLTCIFVDTGLLRKNEANIVMQSYGDHFHIDIIKIEAKERFYQKLKGITDPEQKRKIIGKEFIEVFNEEAQKIQGVTFLAQGTIYPDVIESASIGDASVVIKSHHNVGGLPEKMHLKLLEPLRELFKDEVRRMGTSLGIAHELIYRHPFPGPGLGIRILGDIDAEKVAILQEADAILIEELHKAQLYDAVSQAFVVLLPVKSVGVQGDERTYEYTCVVRSADTIDFMTATWSKLPYDLLEKVSNRIINEVTGINRVCYDISSKPPATIEWE